MERVHLTLSAEAWQAIADECNTQDPLEMLIHTYITKCAVPLVPSLPGPTPVHELHFDALSWPRLQVLLDRALLAKDLAEPTVPSEQKAPLF